MLKKRTVSGFLGLGLLLFGSSILGHAGDTCTGTESCTNHTCDPNNCKVVLSNNGSTLVMQVQIAGGAGLQTVSYFCVAAGTTILWQTSNDFFFTKFATSPFTAGQMTVSGLSGSAVGLNASAVNGCYTFGAAACQVAAIPGGGGSCGEADPKIVITGGHMGKGHKKGDHDKDEDEKQ